MTPRWLGLPAGSPTLDAGLAGGGHPLKLASLVWRSDVQVHAIDLDRVYAAFRHHGRRAFPRRPTPHRMNHRRDWTTRRRLYRAGYRMG